MSAFFDRADDIANRIKDLFDDGDVVVIVDRQKDILSEFNKHIGKIRGGVVVISWAGAPDINQDVDTLRMSSKYLIHVFCNPVLRKAEQSTPCDNIIQTIAQSIHNWQPGDSVHCAQEVKVKSITPVPDERFLIFNIQAEQLITANPTS